MNIPNCECESENKMFTLSCELLSKAISLGVEQGLQSLLSISNNDKQINRLKIILNSLILVPYLVHTNS